MKFLGKVGKLPAGAYWCEGGKGSVCGVSYHHKGTRCLTRLQKQSTKARQGKPKVGGDLDVDSSYIIYGNSINAENNKLDRYINLIEYKTKVGAEKSNMETENRGTPSSDMGLLTTPDYTKEPYMSTPVGAPKQKPRMVRDSEEFKSFDSWAKDLAHIVRERSPYSEMLASEYSKQVHAGQTDQTGVDYYLHPQAVRALMMETAEYAALSEEDKHDGRIAAILHDVVEDTAVTSEDLRNWGFSEKQISTIDALSKRVHPDGTKEGTSEYFERLKQAGPVAVAVKLGDLGHNTLEPRRATLEGAPGVPVPPGGENRYVKLARKYVDAIQRLGGTPPEHLVNASKLPM